MLQAGTGRSTSSHPLDRPLSRRPGEVSLAAFTLLFSELVQLHQVRSSSVPEFEAALCDAGRQVGSRALQVHWIREGKKTRETRILGILQFLSSTIWPGLFNKKADSLERGVSSKSEYMIHDANPLPTVFCEVPRSLGGMNPNAFVSGIIQGVLETAGFGCDVTAHRADEGGSGTRTVFLVNFHDDVVERDEMLEGR
mmetsp:Transcript_17348/g.34833  ORF Transcript_17348/g.34833 Transcript_17348/m.34833 type:complete len:197 (+) Transcript_17348:171-761(+)